MALRIKMIINHLYDKNAGKVSWTGIDWNNSTIYLPFLKHLSIYQYIRVTNTRQKITLFKYKNVMKETIEGYKLAYEPKKKILYSRMDDSMIDRLREIRKKTGISVSEIIRESVRRLIQEVDETGSIQLKIK